jgi:hypothetical protein
MVTALFSIPLVAIQASMSALPKSLRIPVKWAGDSGDVGQSRSEATLVVFLH